MVEDCFASLGFEVQKESLLPVTIVTENPTAGDEVAKLEEKARVEKENKKLAKEVRRLAKCLSPG